MLFGRPLQSRLDLVFPMVKLGSRKNQTLEGLEDFSFQIEFGTCRDFSREKWIPGKISKTTGPLSYEFHLENFIFV